VCHYLIEKTTWEWQSFVILEVNWMQLNKKEIFAPYLMQRQVEKLIGPIWLVKIPKPLIKNSLF